MRSKKLAANVGLITVLLISLTLASTCNAWYLTVKTPDLDWWYVDWWTGGIVFAVECGTQGADIRYTWQPGYGEAHTPTVFSELYEGPLLATCIGQFRARGFKNFFNPSGTLTIDFR